MEIKTGVSLKKYNSLRVGGKAKYFKIVNDDLEIKETLDFIKKNNLEFFILGNGTNILFSDEDYPGVIIKLGKNYQKIEILNDSVRAGGGVNLSLLLNYIEKKGYGGLEFLWGIPGTVAGAVKTNAGTKWGEIGKIIEEIELIDFSGNKHIFNRQQIKFFYRECKLPIDGIITQVKLRLQSPSPELKKEIISFRGKSQPLNRFSAGCIFKNPSGDYAGRLISAAGLKGKRIGDAQISEIHSNFIINLGRAKSKEIKDLIELIKKEVQEKFSVDLQEEIIYVGNFKRE